jgi:hypothetical protein
VDHREQDAVVGRRRRPVGQQRGQVVAELEPAAAEPVVQRRGAGAEPCELELCRPGGDGDGGGVAVGDGAAVVQRAVAKVDVAAHAGYSEL